VVGEVKDRTGGRVLDLATRDDYPADKAALLNTYVAGNEAEARQIVRHCLQRRGTAKKRIGVAYRLRELMDPARRMAGFPNGFDRTSDQIAIDDIRRNFI